MREVNHVFAQRRLESPFRFGAVVVGRRRVPAAHRRIVTLQVIFNALAEELSGFLFGFHGVDGIIGMHVLLVDKRQDGLRQPGDAERRADVHQRAIG